MLKSLMMLLAQLEQDGPANAVAEKTAEGGAAEPPGSLIQLLFPLMAAMLVIMLLMRPKKVDQKQKQLLEGLKKNDRVVTAGGIIGVVSQIRDDENYVTIRIDESSNAKMQIIKSSIVKVMTDETADSKEK